jgi:large subunit ribosomal protein L7e
VPESVLKKRKRDENWTKQKKETELAAKKKSRDERKVIFKRAEAYVKEYRQQVGSRATRGC